MTAPIRRSDPGRTRDAYTGPQIHCTRWRDQQELDHLHVAVVGGGAALARVVPPVVARARRVTVFHHDPVWILPIPPLPGARLLLGRLPADFLGSLPAHSAPSLPEAPSGSANHTAASAPSHPVGAGTAPRPSPLTVESSVRQGLSPRKPARRPILVAVGDSGLDLLRWCGRQALRQAAAVNLRAQVGDSWERRQLTPDRPAAVRVHSRYYRALRQPNCRLISWPIARLAPLGIRTVDGVEHQVDCIIYAEDAS
ncbi:NAD(P)/FAD-dependent oxidoreductase [Nocardia aurantiaca]|uniref:Uncharacterized protein n=1 Tax=Nocardia aurantiaca TaxID=2675850 RepID=A0A6I3KR72_9NOCA|nr:hypothetical protein [Nocardia aurantiaca]